MNRKEGIFHYNERFELESGETLNEIVSSVKKVGDIVAEIAAASQEQSAGIDQVNQTVCNLDELTQQNAALAEQTSAASVSMSERAEAMAEQVQFFRLSEAATAAAPSAAGGSPSSSKTPPAASAEGASSTHATFASDEEWEEF